MHDGMFAGKRLSYAYFPKVSLIPIAFQNPLCKVKLYPGKSWLPQAIGLYGKALSVLGWYIFPWPFIPRLPRKG
jgi:hypothetical protein